MYLTEPQLFDNVKKQLQYKFNGYTGVFTSLLIVQVIGILLGIGTSGGSHTSYSETLTVIRNTSSNDIVVMFTLFWAFITGILITTTAYRNDAFTFVSNRLSHHLSSILFLLASSVFAGITAILTGSLIKFITLIWTKEAFVETPGLLNTPSDFFIQIGTAVAYMVLFAGIGYAIGSFTQRSMMFVPFLFLAIFSLPLLFISMNISVAEYLIFFYGPEQSFLLFITKVFGTVLLLFVLSIIVTNRKEVRR